MTFRQLERAATLDGERPTYRTRICDHSRFVFGITKADGTAGVLSEAEDNAISAWAVENFGGTGWIYLSWHSIFCTDDAQIAMAFKLRWC